MNLRARVFLTVFLSIWMFSASAFAQTDRGTITGAVADASSAVIPGAQVTATNTQTTAKYETVSTETGNYTITQLPAGVYEVTVSADAPLLRTESGDLSHNIRTDSVDALPVLSIGAAAGSSGIRNPTAVAQLLPGAYVVPNTTVKINGAPGNTASYRLEGQDASNGQVPATQAQVQPSVDALQEVTILTNYFTDDPGTRDYDAAAQLGLKGTTSNRIFPSFQGLTITLMAE